MASHSRHVLRTPGSRLTKLIRQAATLDRLTEAVQRLLPDAVAPHCRGVALRGRTLTVFVDSSVWATRVRFYQNYIRNGLGRRHKTDVRRLRVKVAPPKSATRAPKQAPRHLSRDTQNLLRTTADGIDDPQLADALRRLGRHR